jgi:hypothetical protein
MKKILHYNAKLNPLKTDLEKKYKTLDYDINHPCNDRYGIIPHWLPMTTISKPLKSNISFNETFENLCDKAATQILNTNKKINVFWSGGLDSTTVLVSLISNCINKDQIHIITSYGSILESGSFYETFLKSYNATFDMSGVKSHFKENELYITGANGNNLFTTGSGYIKRYVEDSQILKKPWKDVTSRVKIELFESVIEKSPKPIKSYEDFLWFNSFAFRWDHTRYYLYRYIIPKPKNFKKYLNIFFSYFLNKDFEQWCIDNNEQQHDINNLLKTTKMPMRKYIFNKLGQKSEDYIKNKQILRSTWLPLDDNYKYITEDFDIHYINEYDI